MLGRFDDYRLGIVIVRAATLIQLAAVPFQSQVDSLDVQSRRVKQLVNRSPIAFKPK